MQKYPDHWNAELVLLVHSDERASDLAEVVAGWRTVTRAVPLPVRALTFRQAAAQFRARLPEVADADREIPIKRSELRLTCSFLGEVVATFKAVRHSLRANPLVRSQGCPYPEYTPQLERMMHSSSVCAANSAIPDKRARRTLAWLIFCRTVLSTRSELTV